MQISRFINAELESESDDILESDSDNDFDNNSDNDSKWNDSHK